MSKQNQKSRIQVAILMGSRTDLSVMRGAAEALDEFGIAYEMKVLSAHRTPHEMSEYASKAAQRGLRVMIAGAGGAAHLPGMLASFSELPVIGVPVPIGVLQGEDAMWSIVQMPTGVPVATVAIGNAYNAGVLAAQILAFGGLEPNQRVVDQLKDHKKALKKKVLSMKI